ncbi:MAG: MBL fold metallo-hydrolase [Clostridiales bacterium]|nr:MBL fold metallo-hydrolase [Clostridiales bacterium]
MKIMFLGATHEVTGSCTMLEVNDHRFLIDCGMEQGSDVFVNQEIPVNPADLDCVILTHAHIDHSGKLPLLYKNGFHGQIYATEATTNLCNIMLRDSAHIQEFEAEWKNRKGQRSGQKPVEPMYSIEDAEGTIRHFVPYPYNKRFTILEGVDIQFGDVGHLLGSSCVQLWLKEGDVERKIVFSGDVGNKDKPILKDPQKVEEADYVVIESTYGDRYHEKNPGNQQYVNQLAEVIQKTLDRGGNVVIPSFAVGRTQELLYYIRQIKDQHMVTGHDHFKVYVDSPLANEATSVFVQCDHSYFDEEMCAILDEGKNPIFFPGLEVAVSSDESRNINFDPEPKVILSASGMCEAGRIRHHLKHNLWRKESTILFAGYQATGTLGRAIFEGASQVKLFGEDIEVNAEIEYLAGISGHADKAGLLDWINSFKKKPGIVFVNHGEDKVTESFAECLMKEHGFPLAVAPFSGTCYDLITGECIVETQGVPVPVKVRGERTKSTGLFETLLAAVKRLTALVASFDGRPNKEVRRLTEDINQVCDKWENR